MANRKSNGHCRRCGELFSLFGEVHIELAGGAYVTSLCSDCQNAFKIFIVDHPAWEAYLTNVEGTNMLFARTSGDAIDRTEEVTQLRDVRRGLLKELHRICGNWLVETKKGSAED